MYEKNQATIPPPVGTSQGSLPPVCLSDLSPTPTLPTLVPSIKSGEDYLVNFSLAKTAGWLAIGY